MAFEAWMHMLTDTGASTMRLSVPLLFAALGGLLSERSGVVNIALEGKMLVGAFAAGAVGYLSGDPWIGFVAGGAAGLILSALYAASVLWFRSNHIVAGTGINILALGIAPLGCKFLFDVTGSTPALELAQRFSYEPLWVSAVVLCLVSYWYHATPSGLQTRVAGEHPAALAAAGGSIIKTRWYALLAAGFLAGLGGASLAVWLSSGYSREMTAGRGFIALAALILGKWKPLPTATACILFGLTDAIQIRLQGVELLGVQVPVQLIQILPYLATLLIVTGILGKSRAPRFLGQATH